MHRLFPYIVLGAALVAVFAFGGMSAASHVTDGISGAPGEHWAWNEVMGWIDFHDLGAVADVVVRNADLTGRITTGVDDGSLNSDGASPAYAVGNSFGALSGWAWNEFVGWVSVCGEGGAGPLSPGCFDTDVGMTTGPNYRVSIDPVTGHFLQYAWNDVVGWVSFNCANHGGCAPVDYKVVTSWLPPVVTGTLDSSIYDTGARGQLNAIIWQGDLPGGAKVGFQLASANCANGGTDPPTCTPGTWVFLGPAASTLNFYPTSRVGTTNEYTTQFTVSDYARFANQQYLRYRVRLTSGTGGASPRVDKVILNWSP
ncbi:MAG: hypothetical protein HY436_00030 [Candidatus Liptonbacteria bacterium]|nr:hypothetical protein [Candidatus Liptonbacteria bacterium]